MKPPLLLLALSWIAVLQGNPITIDLSIPDHDWRISPADTIETSASKASITLKVVQTAKSGDAALSKRIPVPPGYNRLAFSADASGNAGYLQVKTLRNGKEIARYSSEGTSSRKRTLRCEFPVDNATELEICLRMKLNDKYLGKTSEFSNLQLVGVNRDPLEVVPLYCSASYYCNFNESTEQPPGEIEFRRVDDDAWQTAYPPIWCGKADRQLRGSIVDLAEDTEYELRFTPENGSPLVKNFRTWKSSVPIAQSIELKANQPNPTIEISDQGSPDGYIRYTVAPHVVLTGGNQTPVIRIRNAKFVILENLTIQGGAPCAIQVQDSDNLIIRNCDISNWGIIGTQRFDRDGKFYDSSHREINFTAGIDLMSCDAVTIEHCRIHEPINRANPWFFSHPAGPQALYVGNSSRMVVRWNDFIGCERHRWNDVIEGWGNFNTDGGFARDSDIYGNVLAFGNDDGIELDGGQMNVRFFDNWIEGTYCGVSTCGCMKCPSFSFRNLISRLGDEMLAGSSSFKSGRGDGMIYIFNNTLLGSAGVNCTNPELRAVTRNNVIQVGGRAIYERKPMPGNSFDYDLCFSSSSPNNPEKTLIGSSIGNHMDYRKAQFLDADHGNYALKPGTPGTGATIELANFCQAGNDLGCTPEDANWPPRPLDFSVDAIRLEFPSSDAPAQFVTLTAKRKFDFKITQNKCFDWFSVEPNSGTVLAGEQLKLSVKPNPSKCLLAGVRRGGFLIQPPNGLSRAVLVYAQCDQAEAIPSTVEPIAVFKSDRTQSFSSGKWSFELKEPRTVYVAVRMGRFNKQGSTVIIRLDDQEYVTRLRLEDLCTYPMVASGGSAFLAKPQAVELKPGIHTLEIHSGQPTRLEWTLIAPDINPLFTRYQR